MDFKERVRRVGVINFVVVGLLIAVIAGLTMFKPGDKAADTPQQQQAAVQKPLTDTSGSTIYMTPSSLSQAPGSSFQVKLYENSKDDQVNVAQLQVRYSEKQLKLDRITEETAFPIVAATDTATPGLIRVARTVPVGTGGVTGKQPVVTLHFTVLPTASGNAAIAYETDGSLIMKASDNTSIVKSTAGADIAIQ